MDASVVTPGDYVALRERAPEFLGDLMDHLSEVLVDGGVDRDQAAVFALYAVVRLRHRWAKQLIYFAEGRAIDLHTRNKAIWDAFNGRNVDELAARYRVSRVWIYRIIEDMRRDELATRQGSLNLGAPAESGTR